MKADNELAISLPVLFKGAFLWDDPDQDQWSEITRIMVRRSNELMNPCPEWIHRFIDLPWSDWSRITDPNPDHLKERTLSLSKNENMFKKKN